MKKSPTDIIILNKCIILNYFKWKSHDRYGSQDSATDRFFCHLGPFFALQKSKFQKNGKNTWWYHHFWFYTSVPKIMIIGYTVPEIWHVTDVIVLFYFGLFFAFLPSPPSSVPLLTAQKNLKCQKNSKNAWSYHPFTQLYQNTWSYAILGLRYRKNKGVGRLHASSRNSETIDVWKVARHPPSTHVVARNDYSF